MRFMGIFRK